MEAETAQQQRDRELGEWLDKHHAFTMWEHRLRHGRVTCYQARGRVFIVMRYKVGGWDVYTAPESLRVDATLAAADRRLGFV